MTALTTAPEVVTLLRLVTTPGIDPLARVVSVLHARRLPVETLAYDAERGRVTLGLRCPSDGDAARAAALLGRVVDVVSVSVDGGRGGAQRARAVLRLVDDC